MKPSEMMRACDTCEISKAIVDTPCVNDSSPCIVSPVCNIDELTGAVEHGAGEVYCGIIPPAVGKLFGFDDMVTRRQGPSANLTSLSELGRLASESARRNLLIALTLNCQYSRTLLPHIIKIAEFWANAGGQAVILTDTALLIALKQIGYPFKYHLSLMANVFNASTIAFFCELGIDRIILPRELKIDEVSRMTALFPGIEFEALVLHDRCLFLDGLCGFYHSTAFLSGTAVSVPWTRSRETGESCIYSSNLSYAGHGCDLVLRDRSKQHFQSIQDQSDHLAPECAACQLPMLSKAGIGFLKLAGRGLPAPHKTLSVGFIKKALSIWADRAGVEEKENRIKALYAQMFGRKCSKSKCYY